MSFIVDIVIVAILLLCTVLGYKRGLIGMAFSIASFLVALIISFILYIPVASFITNNTGLDETIQNAIISNFKEEATTTETNNMSDVISNYIEQKTNEVKNAGVEAAAVSLSELSVKAISFIGLYIFAKIILLFFSKIADLIAELPLLKQFNKAGGFLAGIIKGLIIIYIVLGILMLVMPMFANLGIYSAINDSALGSVMFKNNILLKIIF